MNDKERVVITGMGLVSPVGLDVETSWQALLNGEHGVENVRQTLFAGYNSLPINVAAPVKSFDLLSDPAFSVYRKEARREFDLSQQFALWAGAQALRQAGLIDGESLKVNDNLLEPERFGVFVGTGIGGADELSNVRTLLETERAEYSKAFEEGDDERMAELEEKTRIRPSTILRALPGRVAAVPSMAFNAKAFWEGILKECASGNGAIISAAKAIKYGEADVVLAGGVEGEISITTIGAFGAAGAVSREKNPDEACRPLDERRSGLVMGQGAGMLVVESMEHAVNRGAPILAEVVGYAENADAKDPTDPDPLNVIKCIAKATNGMENPLDKLEGISVNGHLTSTINGDRGEMSAIRGTFEPRQLVGIAATKAATGHMLGGAGAAEAVFSVLSLRDSKTPPIRNLESPIAEAKGYEHLMNPEAPIEADIRYVVNQSFGFGGNNAVTIFARPR